MTVFIQSPIDKSVIRRHNNNGIDFELPNIIYLRRRCSE